MNIFSYSTKPMYVNGKSLNHFGFYQKHGKIHIDSWFWFLFDSLTHHTYNGDPDICCRCGVFER